MGTRRFLSVSVLTLTVGLVIFGNSAIQSTVLQTNPDECRATVSGKEKPDQVLAQDVWEATLMRVAAFR